MAEGPFDGVILRWLFKALLVMIVVYLAIQVLLMLILVTTQG